MSTGAARPTKCAKCGATPKCPGTNCNKCVLRQEGTCLIGYWEWECYKEDTFIIWYVVCPDCLRIENAEKGEMIDKQRETAGTIEE